jgi:hypothetical protein
MGLPAPAEFSLSWGMTADGVSACRIGIFIAHVMKKKHQIRAHQIGLVQTIEAAL